MPDDSFFPVALTRCHEYSPELVDNAVDSAFSAIGYAPAYGGHVLVKPNLLKTQAGGLCCTHPLVISSACRWLLDHGIKPVVGDSPAFGSALSVAKGIGLLPLLQQANVPVVTLDAPRRTTLPCGIRVGISQTALEADALLNLPRLKAHTQMRLTLGVKNLFGCVTGVRKAIAHTVHGDNGDNFRSLLIECALALPPATTLLDGIIGMDRTGPANGDPFPLGLIAAANDPFALDTAIYTLLGCQPQDIPLWAASRSRGSSIPQAFRSAITYPLLSPQAFNEHADNLEAEHADVTPTTGLKHASQFRMPEQLTPETFHPLKLAQSACKRFWKRYCVSGR